MDVQIPARKFTSGLGNTESVIMLYGGNPRCALGLAAANDININRNVRNVLARVSPCHFLFHVFFSPSNFARS